jgi:hypothetical protein
MNTILFISILLLAVAAFALHRRKLRTAPKEPDSFPEQRSFDGLFAEQHAEEMKLLEQAEAERRAQEERRGLLSRAAEGDKTALDEANLRGDAEFYRDILGTLVAYVDGDEDDLRSIADHIIDSRALRSSSEFAAMMIERLSAAPDQSSLACMLHLAALSDDAAVFKRAVGEGRLPGLSAGEFLAAVESAYWLIEAEVRSSGSGFLLKRLIVDVRRGLAAASRRSGA